MKLEVTVDGEKRSFVVDLERGVLTFDGREVPVKIVQDSFARVELEIAGEKFIVEGWPPGSPEVPGPMVANGERFAVALTRSHGAAVSPGAPTPGPAPSAAVPNPSAPGDGTVVTPPMPGRVVEVRVKAGESVTKGQVLLVLEAMKMRNEVVSPVTGTVVTVAVAAGANVRARETLVTLRPEP